MKKGLKITAIAVVVLLLLMFILPFAFRGKIESIVKSEGNKMLNAQFDFRSLDISLFRNFPKASITLSEFYLRGTGEFEKDTLVQAGEIIAAIDLFSLFGDKGYDVSKIQIATIYHIFLPGIIIISIKNRIKLCERQRIYSYLISSASKFSYNIAG